MAYQKGSPNSRSPLRRALPGLTIVLAAVLVLLIMTAWPVLSALLHPGDYTSILALNWDLSLPSGSQSVYETDSGASFHGDGTRYHVLDYPESSTLETVLSWQDAPPAENLEAEMTQLLDNLSVPQEERPDMTRCRWYSATDPDDSRNCLYLLLSPSGTRLYIMEFFC